jgi:hypothetical protein
MMDIQSREGDPMRLIKGATAVTLLLAAAALAWNHPSKGNQAAALKPEQSTTQVQQAKIERALQGAGFTDIETMPTSFLVRAQNPEGKSIMMIVDPTSIVDATS